MADHIEAAITWSLGSGETPVPEHSKIWTPINPHRFHFDADMFSVFRRLSLKSANIGYDVRGGLADEIDHVIGFAWEREDHRRSTDGERERQ